MPFAHLSSDGATELVHSCPSSTLTAATTSAAKHEFVHAIGTSKVAGMAGVAGIAVKGCLRENIEKECGEIPPPPSDTAEQEERGGKGGLGKGREGVNRGGKGGGGGGGGSVLKRTYIKTGKHSKPNGKTNGMVPVNGKIEGSSKATGVKKGGGGKGGGGEVQESPSSEMPTRRCVCI